MDPAGALDLLLDIARHAGNAVMDVYATDFSAREKADESPLTEADLRADRIIREGLEAAFPGVYILSEESVSPGQGVPGTFFLVDPLDGTKEFLKRNGEFTVNIARIQDGRVVAAVVLAPALGELFWASAEGGAWKEDAAGTRRLRVSSAGGTTALRDTAELRDAAALRVIGSRSHGAEALERWLAGLERPCDFVAAGSSLKFCRIAEGAADIYPRLGPTSQWDTAAAQGILEIAGGAVVDLDGVPLRYGLDRGILNPHFVAVGDPALLALVPGLKAAG